MITIAIHQPNYFPWIGYFLKMEMADKFVYHDAVTINTRGYTRRCYIRPRNFGENQRLSISLENVSQNQLIKDVKLSNNNNWQIEHWNIIERTYQNSKYFSEVSPWLSKLIHNKELETLSDYNIVILDKLKDYLEIETPCVKSSNLTFIGESTDAKHQSIVKELNGDHYLSGVGSKAYQDDQNYAQQGIEISYIESLSLLQSVVDSNRAQLSVLDYLFDFSQTELIDLIKTLTA